MYQERDRGHAGHSCLRRMTKLTKTEATRTAHKKVGPKGSWYPPASRRRSLRTRQVYIPAA